MGGDYDSRYPYLHSRRSIFSRRNWESGHFILMIPIAREQLTAFEEDLKMRLVHYLLEQLPSDFPTVRHSRISICHTVHVYTFGEIWEFEMPGKGKFVLVFIVPFAQSRNIHRQYDGFTSSP